MMQMRLYIPLTWAFMNWGSLSLSNHQTKSNLSKIAVTFSGKNLVTLCLEARVGRTLIRIGLFF